MIGFLGIPAMMAQKAVVRAKDKKAKKRIKEATEIIGPLMGGGAPTAYREKAHQGTFLSKHFSGRASASSPFLKNPTKDACYYSVKARYDVFPSAYASGAIAKCRKRGGPKKKK